MSTAQAALLTTAAGTAVTLENLYHGASAFLICSGPSLTTHDLSPLQNRGVLTLAVNNAAAVVRPQWWCSVDDPGNFCSAIWRDPGILKFVPADHFLKPIYVRNAAGELVSGAETVAEQPGVLGFRRNETFDPETWLTSETFNWGMRSDRVDSEGNKGSRSVMYVALRLLHHLGIRQVYLLGCDFRMESGRANYAFEQERSRSSVRGNNSSYRILNQRFSLLKPKFDEAGFHVVNCTPNSGLTVFPYVPYEAALQRVLIEKNPLLDTAGRYDRKRREKEAAEQGAVSPVVNDDSVAIPEFSLVIFCDDLTREVLGETWKSWQRQHPVLRDCPVICLLPPGVAEDDLPRALRQSPRVRCLPTAGTLSQDWRVWCDAGQAVTTPWWCLLDGSAVGTPGAEWPRGEWFAADESGKSPAVVGSAWSYSKPAELVSRWESWRQTVPELSKTLPIALDGTPDGKRFRHPTISRWCCFVESAWFREVVRCVDDRCPVSDPATRLHLLALTTGRTIRRPAMKEHGWEHAFGWTADDVRKWLPADVALREDEIDAAETEPPSPPSRGVIYYNRGEKCLIRLLVSLSSLRNWWTGPVTVFLEGVHPDAFVESVAALGTEVRYSENPAAGAFIRKLEVCRESPYDRTLWLDSDTVVIGPIEELFDELDTCDVATPHFAGWMSHGRRIRKRIEQYRGQCPDEWLTTALEPHPAVNTGVFSIRRDASFLEPWLELSRKGDHGAVSLPEEIALQILYPTANVRIVSPKFGASVKHDPGTDDIRIVHYHGQKHVHEFPLCEHWKREFQSLLNSEQTRLNELLSLADKRLKRYLKIVDQVTIVTACDERYVEKLRLTFPQWVRRKQLDRYPVLVFIHGITLDDSRLDFLRRPNVRLVAWEFPAAETQREQMLSAFVFGTAREVTTKWWLKLDADTFAVDDSPLVSEDMKEFVLYGHRWGRSIAAHIETLDRWAAAHPKLKTPPLFESARVDGEKFLHPRLQSFLQLEATWFTRLGARLAGPRLPVPSHDTYTSYLADRLGYPVARVNVKALHGVGHTGRMRKLREATHG